MSNDANYDKQKYLLDPMSSKTVVFWQEVFSTIESSKRIIIKLVFQHCIQQIVLIKP